MRRNHGETDRVFFDLNTDTVELTNRIHDDQCQTVIADLAQAVTAWRPGPVTKAYLDEDALRIKQPNVPSKLIGNWFFLTTRTGRSAGEGVAGVSP